MASGFSFGTTTTAAPVFGTGSLTFGAPAPQPPQQFGFGGLSSAAPPLFGTQTAPVASSLAFNKPASGFGNPAAPTTAFGTSFGAPTSAPSTGFGFGGSSFTTPASSAPGAGLSFGAPVSTAPSLNFGAPASSAPTFGAPTLSFGAPAASTATGLSFGTPASAPSTGLTFGTPASTAPGLNFGGPTSTGLSFGAPTSTASPFATPNPQLSTGLSFGAATSAPTLGGLNFGAVPTTAPAPTLNFGLSTSSAAPTLNFGPAPVTTATSLGFGLGWTSTASSTAPASTPTQAQVGLGGVVQSLSKPGASATAQKEVPPKEQPLMNEFAQLVEQFKKVVQDEKLRSSEVARCSVKEFHKVESNLDVLNNHFNQIENQLQSNRTMVEGLKMDTAKGLQNIEMAQRTQETPPGLQYDNSAPMRFFMDLVDTFEREMQILRVRIDNTEKFVKKSSEWNVLTSQDLTAGFKRLHEIFVALAGRMQAIHNQVEIQKEIFLSIRRQTVKDNVNPFEKASRNSEALNIIMTNTSKSPPQISSGPTPFNNIAVGANLALRNQSGQQGGGFGMTATTAPAQGMFSGSNMFKPADFTTQPFQLGNSQNFQLQKPPTGNKRGKQ